MNKELLEYNICLISEQLTIEQIIFARRNRDWRKSNRGRRLDHIWVTQPLKHQLKSITTLKEARDWIRPSDHVPFMIEL